MHGIARRCLARCRRAAAPQGPQRQASMAWLAQRAARAPWRDATQGRYTGMLHARLWKQASRAARERPYWFSKAMQMGYPYFCSDIFRARDLPCAHGPSRAASLMLPMALCSLCEGSERADNKLDNNKLDKRATPSVRKKNGTST